MRRKSTKKTIDDYLYHIVIGGFIIACLLTYISEIYKDTRTLREVPVIENSIISKHNDLQDTAYEINENDFFVDWTLYDAKQLFTTSLKDATTIPVCPST